MRQDTYGVCCDLSGKVEALAWDCRINVKVPVHIDNPNDGFGYLCDEYWNPDPASRSIDLSVFPFWVDKELVLSRIGEVWEWADDQIARIVEVIDSGIRRLADLDVKAEKAIVPNSWGVFCIKYIHGVPLFFSDSDFGIYTSPEFGRFVPLL